MYRVRLDLIFEVLLDRLLEVVRLEVTVTRLLWQSFVFGSFAAQDNWLSVLLGPLSSIVER